MRMLIVFVWTVSLVAAKTEVKYKNYYKFEEGGSFLRIKTLVPGTHDDLHINFYDKQREYITHFEWKYSNTFTLEDCKTVKIDSTSPYYNDRYSHSFIYNDRTRNTRKISNFTIYKSNSRFLVEESGVEVFSVKKSLVCSAKCSNIFNSKVAYIEFSNDNIIQSFYIEPVICELGYYLNDTLSCNKCPPNTYSIHKDMECKRCPLDSRSSEGSKSIYDCKLIICLSGYALSIDGNCTVCPNGTYSFEGQVVCKSCPDGTTSHPGSTHLKDCKECERGSVINSLTKNCERCPNGTYTGGSNSTKCHPCPIGKTSYQGSSAYRDCHWKCKPGEVIRGDGCLQCPQDTFSPGKGATTCRKCPKNTTSPPGSTKKNCKKVINDEKDA